MKFKHFLYWFLRYVFLLLSQRASRFVLRWRLALGRKKSVFVIDSVFCQLGNNIQQIFVAIAHADRYSGSIPMSSEFYEHTTELGIIPEDLPRYVDQESLSNFLSRFVQTFSTTQTTHCWGVPDILLGGKALHQPIVLFLAKTRLQK